MPERKHSFFREVFPYLGNLWQLLAILSIVGNILVSFWQLLVILVNFWLLYLMHFLPVIFSALLALFGNLFQLLPMLTNFGNTWQLLAIQVTVSLCHQVIYSSYHLVILSSCPLFIWQSKKSAYKLVSFSACAS